MEAVQPLSNMSMHGMGFGPVLSVGGATVRNVWTKFFFDQKNLLCFQVLLQTKSGETIPYQEFKDYSEYKNTLDYLHNARTKNAVIEIPRKSAILVDQLEKWHGFRKV